MHHTLMHHAHMHHVHMHYDQGTYMYMHRADMHHVYMHQGQGFSMHEKFASSYMHPIRLLESPCSSVRLSGTQFAASYTHAV